MVFGPLSVAATFLFTIIPPYLGEYPASMSGMLLGASAALASSRAEDA